MAIGARGKGVVAQPRLIALEILKFSAKAVQKRRAKFHSEMWR
nr:hypothetical protein [uncultured Campylobacter sp.]